ncbi:MAG: 16S rRNA (uracil(1498)-N(3))-methyltransferase [Bacteroidales bacterium]
MQLFYAPDIEFSGELPEDESQHCIKVLRMTTGDEICVTDGKGNLFQAVIVTPNHKRCTLAITDKRVEERPWRCRIEIAIAPTKNIERTEWFAEKCTELGIDAISLLNCRFSERKDVKAERLDRVLISAMKQSLKYTKPKLSVVTPFKEFIKHPFDGYKFIAHCHEGEKPLLKEAYKGGVDCLIMIGPEGDFSTEEVAMAKDAGFIEISLGKSRLRTETAGVAACHTIQLINQ